jgi:glutaredoxin
LAKGVEFEEFDVTRDREALWNLVEVHGSRITPTVVIDGQVMIGFDPERLDAALGAT